MRAGRDATAGAAGAGTARRSILITGCSSGIGLDAARSLHAGGWRVFATCRNPDDCRRLIAEGLESFPLDHADEATIAAAVDETLARTGGGLDAVFHNGAYAIPGPVEDVPTAAMRAIFEANFFGWHELTRRLVPVMRGQGHGRIVFCSSILGFIPAKYRGAYIATKHAVEGYADTLRLELRGAGIRVSLLQPGPIDTAFRANAIRQFERWIDWENSLLAEEYRAHLLDRLYKGSGDSRFQLPPAAVTAALRHAIESPRPKARYRITVPTRAMALARRLLPGAAIDRIVAGA